MRKHKSGWNTKPLLILIAVVAVAAIGVYFFGGGYKPVAMSAWAPHQGVQSFSRNLYTVTINYRVAPGTTCCNNLDTDLIIFSPNYPILGNPPLQIDENLCSIYQGTWTGSYCAPPFTNAEFFITSPNSRPGNVEYKVDLQGDHVRLPSCDPCGCTFGEAADVLHTCELKPTFTGVIKIQPINPPQTGGDTDGDTGGSDGTGEIVGNEETCGNSLCIGSETCSTCPSDCGACTSTGDTTGATGAGGIIPSNIGSGFTFIILILILAVAVTGFVYMKARKYIKLAQKVNNFRKRVTFSVS